MDAWMEGEGVDGHSCDYYIENYFLNSIIHKLHETRRVFSAKDRRAVMVQQRFEINVRSTENTFYEKNFFPNKKFHKIHDLRAFFPNGEGGERGNQLIPGSKLLLGLSKTRVPNVSSLRSVSRESVLLRYRNYH